MSRKKGVSKAALMLPLATSVLLLTLVFFFAGADASIEVLGTALATATVAGKFAVLRGLHEEGFFDSPYKLALLIVYMDIMVAFIAVYNIGVLHRIPRFGKKIRGLQDNGVKILKINPWMRKATFFGVIAFVMFPLTGTGAIGGAIFGRLLGMSRERTLVGIAIGACLGAFAMAALAEVIGEQLEAARKNPIFALSGIAVVGGVGYWLYRRYKAMMESVENQFANDDANVDQSTSVPTRSADL